MASSPTTPPPTSSPDAVPPASPITPPPPSTTTPQPQAASPPPQPGTSPPSTPATPPQSSAPQSAPPPVPAASPINLSPPPSSPPSNVTPPPPQPVSPSPSPPPPPPPNESPPPTPIIRPPVLPPPGAPPISSPPPSITTPPPVNSPPPPSTRPTSSPPPPPPPSPPTNPPSTSPSPPPPSTPQRSPPPPSNPQRSPPPPAPILPSDPPPPPASQPTLSPSPPSNLSPPPQQAVSPPPAKNSSPPPSLPSTSTSNNGIGTLGAVAIGVAVGILVISLIGFTVWCCKRGGKKASQSSEGHMTPPPSASSATTDSTVIKVQSSAPQVRSSSGSDFIYIAHEQGGLGNSRTWFSYDELDKATNSFSLENLLGEGGFGSVYKGCLPDGREIAVKVLKVGQGHGDREFKAEVKIISRVHHRNLVSLVGCCIADDRKLLVYDYVPNNTLYFHLHGDGRPALDWATRVRIAAGSARGVAYLHEDCHPRIIHRDIKSSNILLDNNFEARVSDFGLAKSAQDAHTHITTRVMGTFGYMAPEYALSGKLNEKSDVYSFGVVLLELITGRKPVDTSQPLGDESLVEWGRPLLNHALNNKEFEGLVDTRLEKKYDESEMFRMIEAAAACVRHSAAKRPRMGQIVRAFDDMATRDLTNGMRYNESEVFNTAQQSLETRLFRRMQFGSQDNSTENFSRSSTEYFSQNNTEYFSQSNTEIFSQTSFSSSK